MTTLKILKVLKDYGILTIGVLLFTFAWGAFMIPNNMSSGGLTGFCTIIQIATAGKIPVSLSNVVINAILLLIAFLIMGKGFGFKTIYCIIMSSVMFQLISELPMLHAVQGNFLYVSNPILIPLFAGLMEAISVTLIFGVGGSTGGTDILALIINKYWPISPAKVFMFMDMFIIASILFIPGKTFTDVMYGYLMMITFAVSLDQMFTGGTQSSVQVLVFSDKFAAIADAITHDLDRGVTVLKAQGWYTKRDKNVLLILAKQKQLVEITKVIKDADPKAFVSVSKTSSVYGEGFEEIKTGLERKKKGKDDIN